MKRTGSAIVILALALISGSASPQEKYATDKPGTWKPTNKILSCGKRIDSAAFTKSVTGVADWLRNTNSFAVKPKGYDVIVGMQAQCPTEESAALPFWGYEGRIHLGFWYYYYNDTGVLKQVDDWAAHGSEFIINNPIYYIGHRLDEHGWDTGDNPTLKETLENALDRLRQYYNSPMITKVIAPGVHLYQDNQIVVSNPDQPPFWIPVTLKEIMEVNLAYYKIKDQIDKENHQKNMSKLAKLGMKIDQPMLSVYDNFVKQYAGFSEEELSRPAFQTPSGFPTVYNANQDGFQIVKFNPDCWNRHIPRSAIQFIAFNHAVASNEGLQEFIRNNHGLLNYVGLFHNAMPLETMNTLIDKK